jgi:predicted site-specific integrase-resolvase
MSTQNDPVIWRADLAKRLHRSSETLRQWIKAGKLPKPDVDLSQKTRGWKLSTLRAAGIDLE